MYHSIFGRGCGGYLCSRGCSSCSTIMHVTRIRVWHRISLKETCNRRGYTRRNGGCVGGNGSTHALSTISGILPANSGGRNYSNGKRVPNNVNGKFHLWSVGGNHPSTGIRVPGKTSSPLKGLIRPREGGGGSKHYIPPLHPTPQQNPHLWRLCWMKS